jgi:hypothetical protein
MRSLAPLTGVLLLLTRFLAAALLLARLLLARPLLAWVLLAWVLLVWALVLLARILVLITHSNSPFSCLAAGVNAFGRAGLRGTARFLGVWAATACRDFGGWNLRGQQTPCKRTRADPPQLPAPVPSC